VDVQKILGEKIGPKKMQELIDLRGYENIIKLAKDWDKYRGHAKTSQAAYFIYCIANSVPPPKPGQSIKSNSNLDANFEQRDYEPEELEKYYANISK
jgi:hypothetical protein